MKRIMVVDDDKSLRFLISETLKIDEDNEVFEAVDGVEALRMYDDVQPDLIILDAMMPTLTGYEVAQRLQDKPVKPTILLLTAQAQSNLNIDISEYGIDYFMSKPFSPMELLIFIDKIKFSTK